MSKERTQTQIERLGIPVAAELGYELIEVEYHKEGPDWILRCTIDKEQGITTDDCQRFSEALEAILDREDPIPGSYLLEVSSPGIERPLKTDRDFIRFTGNQIELRLKKVFNNLKTFRGELLGLFDEGPETIIKLKIQGEQVLDVPKNEVLRARLISEIFGDEGGRKKK